MWCIYLHQRPSYGRKTKSKMATAAILNCTKSVILVTSDGHVTNVYLCTKFKYIHWRQRYGGKTKSKMAPVAVSNFAETGILYTCLCISKMAAIYLFGFVILQWCNDPVQFDRGIAILCLCWFGWKMPNHTPLGAVFGSLWGKQWSDVDPQRPRCYFGVFYLNATFHENQSRSETVWVWTDGAIAIGQIIKALYRNNPHGHSSITIYVAVSALGVCHLEHQAVFVAPG